MTPHEPVGNETRRARNGGPPEVAASSGTGNVAAARETVRVLVLDDEAPIRRLLQNWVEAEGASVLEAGTSEQALAAVEAGAAPAVALCDIRLPGKDGLWFAARLREKHPDTAVVMITGVNQFDAAITSLHAGVVDYLVKPFTRERLVEALQRALFVHRSRLALAAIDRELDARRAQIAEALAEIEANATGSLDAMLSMLRTRDAGAYERAHRVARMAVNLAMTLGITEPHLSDIERAALLNNLGRLALPDALLARPESALTADERALVRAHPLHAHTMLRNIPILAGAAELAVAVHERWDGSGFPRGVRGEEIPLGARIVGVADAFEALVTRGDAPLAPAEAVAVLSGERAGEFDARVLAALRTLQPPAVPGRPAGDAPGGGP